MGVNLDKPHKWKDGIALSVDLYNTWFLRFAPATYRNERAKATAHVLGMLQRTRNLRGLTPDILGESPAILPVLRMSTAPPIARDRLIGLAELPKSLVGSMEKVGRLPPQMSRVSTGKHLRSITKLVKRLIDTDIFPWLNEARDPTRQETYRAATIVADRLCGANADPIVRNAQERRQLALIEKWLKARDYKLAAHGAVLAGLKPGEFAFRLNLQGLKDDGRPVNIPVDAVVVPRNAKRGELPLLIEAKSAGDFTNTNKRRKEEATKVAQLRRQYGKAIHYILFLCGYFDSGYLGYEAGELIDWVWEHRMAELAELGL